MKTQDWMLLFVVGSALSACSGTAVSAGSDINSAIDIAQQESGDSAPDSPYPDRVPDARVEGFGTFEDFVEAPRYDDIMSAFDSLWLANGEDGHVSRLDLETGQTTATIEVGDPEGELGTYHDHDPLSLAVTDEGVWVTDRAGQALALIDPATNEVVREIPIDAYGYDLVVDGDLIWVTDPDTKSVLRINTTSGEIEAVIELNNPVNIATGHGSIWVSQPAYQKVSRIDPATNEVVTNIGFAAGISDILFAEDSLWVSTISPPGLTRIDPATNEEAARIRFGADYPYVWGIAYGEGSIWQRVGTDGPDCDNSTSFIARIDTSSNTEMARMYLNCVQSVLVIGDMLWGQLTPSSGGTPIARIRLDQ